jgi:hypothetical protein
MRSTRLWVLAALPLALTACGGDDAAEDATDDAAVVTTDSAATMTVPMPGDTGMGGASAMGGAVTMNAVGSSGVTGEAQLIAQGQEYTMVTVNLTAPGSATHSGHIHTGTCASPGAVVVPLKDVTLGNGSGTSSTSIQVPMATVMNGQHIVAYHAGSGENLGAPVVCGEIPAHQGQAM